ncbi:MULTISPECIES: type II secretion system F family protein [unclassified Janthinobacterium]|uniref:type II secretion system F family protein n=1 Tax=unclassified Janthinobacterium TaxID=2610881 RepID=UPI00162131BC|nr:MULTISPECIES: type II secretion system F family protein [unclassified Janthinobacterium]MBB5610721.1 type IV pilus assembly protein PilC [Janthinobacterium sp. S3T4]MBB5616207.1 type IV pilus assembly protein PilC [Janthinobacterium sp. S3M3]
MTGERQFAWVGTDRHGKRVQGSLRAADAAAVILALRRQGILATRVRARRHAPGKAITHKDIALFTRQLSTMMAAGVPLLHAFDIAGKGHAKPAITELMADLRHDIEAGSSLQQAFRQFPKLFDSLYCSLLAAGEQAGIVQELLARLATHQEKSIALRRQLRGAIMYPLAIVFVAIFITAIIMSWVVPAFRQVFDSFGAPLPLPTLMVMAISAFLVRYWLAMLAALALLGLLLHLAWRRSPALRTQLQLQALRLPLFGPLLRRAAIARWTRTLAAMFAAGVPLLDSLALVGAASNHPLYQDATLRIEREIRAGGSLALAMDHSGVFPELLTQLALIGEESGVLDTMLTRAADIIEAEIAATVTILSSLLEPALMVVLGVLVGGLVIALYLPIFKLGAVI